MWQLLLILLLFPTVIQASCTGQPDRTYNAAVSRADYSKAFDIVAAELRLTAEEKHHVQIIEGYSRAHDDRNGQADPESLELRFDPGLFAEGKEGACQGVAHEVAHLRQFLRDRNRLHLYFSTHSVTSDGWSGCDRTEGSSSPSQSEQDAYLCLQDNALVAHATAMDIEAVLAQVPYATGRILRDEDRDYLSENLVRWVDSQPMITDHGNESYYLPEIKKDDVQTFCHGYEKAKKMGADVAPLIEAWNAFCRVKR